MSNSPLVTYTKLSPNHSGKRTKPIDTITIHCVVGHCTVKTIGDIFAPTSRQASSNYGVDDWNGIGLYVDEVNRSWCTSSNANDQRAITIEVASDTTEPYAFTASAYETLTKLVVDICKRNNIKKLVWSTDKNARVNHLNGCNLTVHRDYADKSCPGNWMYNKMGEFAAEVNKRLEPAPTPSVDNEATIWNFLKGKGFNNFGVAGLMGNLYAESALRPNNLQNSYETKLGLSDAAYTESVDNGKYTNFVKDSAGYGLAQWTFWSRKEMLLNFATAAKKSIGDLAMQLDFLYKEISENYKTLAATLKNATSVREASDAVLTQYERPADQSEAVQKTRASYGQKYYDKFVVATPEPAPTPSITPYTVKVNITDLNIRSGAGTNYKIVGQTGKGVFTIVDEASGQGATKWGKLKSGAGWISLDFIEGAAPVKTEIANGDLVDFKGGNYYVSSTGGKYYTGKPGKARVTQIAKGAKYPYHVIRTGNETSVYGWVAADLVSK